MATYNDFEGELELTLPADLVEDPSLPVAGFFVTLAGAARVVAFVTVGSSGDLVIVTTDGLSLGPSDVLCYDGSGSLQWANGDPVPSWCATVE